MSTDPYSAPESSVAPAYPPPPPTKAPARMVVFGILHIIGAVIGLGGIMMEIAQGDPKDAIVKAFDQPGMDVTVSEEALSALDPVIRFTVPMTVGTLIVATVLLISGIGLLKSARWSLKLSNIYCALSVVLNTIFLVLGVLYFAPAFKEFLDKVTGMEPAMEGIMRFTFKVQNWAPLFVLIYPILSFFLLNQGVVKKHLEAR